MNTPNDVKFLTQIVPTRLELDGTHAHLTVGPCSKSMLRPLVDGARRFTVICSPNGWLVEKIDKSGKCGALIGVDGENVTRSAGHDIIQSLTLWHQPAVGPRRKACERAAVIMEMTADGSGSQGGTEAEVDLPLIFEFTRKEVEDLDFTRFLKVFGPEHLPCGRDLAAFRGCATFLVDGYNNDPRELWQIPQVRRFYSAWCEAWPYALYFADLSNQAFLSIALCCIDSVAWVKRDGDCFGRVSFGTEEMRRWVMSIFDHLVALSLRAGTEENECQARFKAVVEYLSTPGLVVAR